MLTDTVPGWRSIGDAGYADHITVRGEWLGTAIQVRETLAEDIETEQRPVSPCPDVVGIRQADETLEYEAAVGGLNAAVARRPELYGGMWRAVAKQDTAIVVVAVAGDIDAARHELRLLFAFPLCLVSVAFSTTELADVIAQLSRMDATWETELVAYLNRVRLRLTVVDDRSLRFLHPHGGASDVSPLVRPTAISIG